MKNRITFFIIYILIGILLILTPTVIFPVCEGKMKMGCNYTAYAELGTGAFIIVLGIISVFFVSDKVRAGISISESAAGILAILFPTVLTGVCKSSEMRCHMATLPMLVIVGVILTLAALINVVYLLKKKGD